MKDYDIVPFDAVNASRDEWTRFHKYRRQRRNEIFPGEPADTDEMYEEWVKVMLDQFEVEAHAAILIDNPDEEIGSLQMYAFKDISPSYLGNEHIAGVQGLSVLKEHRRKGIGLAFLKLAHEFAVKKGKRVLIGSTSEQEGRELNHKLGGKEALEMRVHRLSMDDVDWNTVEQWYKDGKERSPDASLEIYSSIPDEFLEDYCRKYTEVYNQMPLEELDVGDTVYTPEVWKQYEEASAKTGETWLSAVIREKNGDISGLSDVLYHPSKAPILTQALTGVDQEYRGQGKGKWVKAAMLLRIRDEFPDIKTISTSTARTNAPMISINERLGFKLHKEFFNMQVETEKVGEFLKRK